MAVSIDYYYTSPSPFAYLGHDLFHDIAARHGTTINYRPVRLADVWAVSGAVPVGQRSPTRQRYRRIELQRIAEMRGLKLNLEPRHFPVDATLADRSVIALVEAGRPPRAFLGRVHKAIWVDDQNVADRALIEKFLRAEGHDAEAVLDFAESAEAERIHAANSQAAITADAIGAPTYVLNGEPFWGQDRLELLDRALMSGRPPFKP